MSCNYIKRMVNLLFAGAVAASTVLPLSMAASAANEETKQTVSVSSQYTTDVLQYRQSEDNDNNKVLLLSAASIAQEELPSLEEYLGKLICTGCGRRCPLTALKCGKGQRYLQEATSTYEAIAAEAAASVEVVIPQNPTVQASATEPETDSSKVSSGQESSASMPDEAPSNIIIAGENIPATTQVPVSGNDDTDPVETAMEYLPLAGLAFGGVYFAVDGARKKKK